MRRHSGLGKIGAATTTGGIYTVDITAGEPYSAVPWLDVNTLPGVDAGADPRIEEGSSLPANKGTPSHDVLAFSTVGKRGLGDIDISEDDKTLYAVNLNQRQLLAVDIASKTLRVDPISIPNPGCSGDDYRPWGLGVHGGSVYIGIVCSAETSRSTADLHAYVQRLDGSNFVNVYDFALNYNRSDLGGGIDGDWQPWARTWTDTMYPSGGGWPMGKATPILSDINFDDDGSLVLGFIDRTGLQSGIDNYSTDTASTNVYENEAGGDLLRVCKDSTGVWVMEGNPGCTTTGGENNGQGPNGSEYYYQDDYAGSHNEAVIGGVALLPGSNETVTTGYDPLSNVRTGGIRWMDNTTGSKIKGYELYSDSRADAGKGTMGKSVGLGDLELLCDPAPTEIGNRVWKDVNSNGIQDADEAGIDGVDIVLTCGSDTAQVTTANGGQFLFSNKTNAMFMGAGESCKVTVASAGQTPLAGLSVSPQNADNVTDNNATTDLRDSDANSAGEIAFTVGNAGENNHTLDFGFKSAPPSTDISLVKVVKPDTAKPGETVVYTLTVTNESDVDATGVKITDQLPAGITWVSDDSAGTYTKETGVWVVGDVTHGANKTLNITATVD
ncbi:MAG: hypothetical protein BWK73_44110 [Thiothrix lacustris]|uniref:DUF11 domain-containing protein n=1 Tax=Thiothrix lacustris TaxID=525917 RepID=A0A1Y1QBH2_9GAMM|nr:MAG: hypothetical protein BWK73_44110 [Thiothrix lacustris]